MKPSNHIKRIFSMSQVPAGWLCLTDVTRIAGALLASQATNRARKGDLQAVAMPINPTPGDVSEEMGDYKRCVIWLNLDRSVMKELETKRMRDMVEKLEGVRDGDYEEVAAAHAARDAAAAAPKVKPAAEPMVTVPRAALEALQRAVDANTAAVNRLENLWLSVGEPEPAAAPAPTLALVAA